MKVSLILPVYNEQLELAEVLAKYFIDLKNLKTDYEVIAINDGSDDGSVKILTDAAKLNRALKIINFDARYGKQAAITAGMAAALGDCVILADVDILNPVGIIEKIVAEFKDGAPIVHAQRERDGWSAVKTKWSDGFVRFSAGLFGVSGQYTGEVSIALYSRDVADIIVALPQKNKLLRTMDNWIDYKIKTITYASGYNKVEERAKIQQAAEQLRKHGTEPAARDKVREHTSSLIYAFAFLISAAVVLCLGIALLMLTALAPMYYFFLSLLCVILIIIAITFLARSALIKRVGVIHNNMKTSI